MSIIGILAFCGCLCIGIPLGAYIEYQEYKRDC